MWGPVGEAGEGRDQELARSLFDMVKPMLAEGKQKDALPYLERSLGSDPQFYPAALAAARAHEALGEKEKASAFYRKVKEILQGRAKRTPEEDELLIEVTQKLLEAEGAMGELQTCTFDARRRLLTWSRTLESKDRPYSALRVAATLLTVAPGDELAAKLAERLEQQVGPVLAATAEDRLGWRHLYKDGNLDGWDVYSGQWETTPTTIRMARSGSFYLFADRAPFRDFVFQARVRVAWGGSCRLLGRAGREGSFYAFGIYMRRRINWETKEVLESTPTVDANCYTCWDRVRGLGWQRPPEKVRLNDDRWYLLEMDCRGNELKLRINDQTIFECEDDRRTLGTVGLQTSGGLDERYVDIREPKLRILRY